MEHAILDPSLDSDLRHLITYMVFLVHTRARYSDGLHVRREPSLDLAPDGYGFVETETLIAKNINSRVFKHRGMTLLGLATGVSNIPWAAHWIGLRKTLGLDVSVQGTLLPMRNPEGGWSQRSLSSTQAAQLLLHFLTSVGAEIPEDFGSHSCKVTWLSWLAKAGVPMETRAVLGGHLLDL
eukprot:6063471-Amphidinium_carterae.2